MTTQIITTISPELFTDIEGAYIPYSQQSLHINEHEQIKRCHTPFSEMKTGKFRKLFNRHTIIFK